MNIREQAKALGIKSWHVKSEANLIVEMNKMTPKAEVIEQKVEKKVAKKKDLYFSCTKKKVSFLISKLNKETNLVETFQIKGDNFVIVINADDPRYDDKKAFLNTEPSNEKNGGGLYKAIANKDVAPSSETSILDDLMVLDKQALASMLGSTANALMSKGQLIEKIVAKNKE